MRDGTASLTAQRVAAHRLSFERVPGPGRPQDDAALARDVAGATAVREGAMREYLRARTAFFDRVVVEALDAGMTQVVIVGAGYDGRAWRYARAGARFFEVDHPSTQADKRRRVARLSLDESAAAFVAVDLERDALAEPLLGAGFDPATRCCAILEGLVVYLTEEVVAVLLAALGDLAADGSELALSVGPRHRGPLRRARHRAFAARVAAAGEPIRSQLTAVTAAPILRAARWAPRPGDPRASAIGLVRCDAA